MRKMALITGSASGLAVVFARRLAQMGYDLALNYRSSKERCERIAKDLTNEFQVIVTTFQADMTQAEEIQRMMDAVQQDFGRLDALIHSAGPFVFTRKRLVDYSVEDWRNMIDGNLTSAFHLCKRAIPLMRPQGSGRIITVGFDRVEHAPGWGYRSAYAAAKVGLASLTRTIAIEERENGITANMICPGDIRDKAKETEREHGALYFPVTQPVGGDLADVISFLLSPQARFVTGNVLSATGDIDVIGNYDEGRSEVFDERIIEVGKTVHVIPWNQSASVIERRDRHNRRSLYSVRSGTSEGQFTIDQLIEVGKDGS